jgi:hypothetical protein
MTLTPDEALRRTITVLMIQEQRIMQLETALRVIAQMPLPQTQEDAGVMITKACAVARNALLSGVTK